MVGPFLAKANATTGSEIWRTYLDNLNASGHWIGNANLNILPDGNVALAWSNQIVLIDGDTGLILKHNTLPGGAAPPENVNYKHLTIAPDGTFILKDQTRPFGCMLQGTVAIIKCAAEGMKQPNSQLTAVDPNTLEVLDSIELPEPATAPHIVTTFEGRIAIYIGMNTRVQRAFWDPATKKLALDDSWIIRPIRKGQSTPAAPTVIGGWIVAQLNGIGSDTVASSVVAASQNDPTKTQVIFPFGELKKGEWSFAPPKCGGDPQNSMIYSADVGMRKVAGIKLDPATGELKLAFVVDATTTTFQPLIGPKDKRVLLLTNMKLNVDKEPVKGALFTENYKEQLTWRNAATGKLLAESDFFEPLSINGLTPPGFGGRIYFPTAVGKGFYVLQVMPKPAENK
jgi:outer membrane protein assembly factor BamB